LDQICGSLLATPRNEAAAMACLTASKGTPASSRARAAASAATPATQVAAAAELPSKASMAAPMAVFWAEMRAASP
jgi:hypothetical protein